MKIKKLIIKCSLLTISMVLFACSQSSIHLTLLQAQEVGNYIDKKQLSKSLMDTNSLSDSITITIEEAICAPSGSITYMVRNTGLRRISFASGDNVLEIEANGQWYYIEPEGEIIQEDLLMTLGFMASGKYMLSLGPYKDLPDGKYRLIKYFSYDVDEVVCAYSEFFMIGE